MMPAKRRRHQNREACGGDEEPFCVSRGPFTRVLEYPDYYVQRWDTD